MPYKVIKMRIYTNNLLYGYEQKMNGEPISEDLMFAGNPARYLQTICHFLNIVQDKKYAVCEKEVIETYHPVNVKRAKTDE